MANEIQHPIAPPEHLPRYPRVAGKVVPLTDDEVDARFGGDAPVASWDMGPHDSNEDEDWDDEPVVPATSVEASDVAAWLAAMWKAFALDLSAAEGRLRRHRIYRLAGNGDGRISGMSVADRRALHNVRLFGWA